VFAKLFESGTFRRDQQPGTGRIDEPRLSIQNLECDLRKQRDAETRRRIWEVPVVSGLNLFFLPAFDTQGDQQQEQCGYCHPRPP
jgi:hypothetical protein